MAIIKDFDNRISMIAAGVATDGHNTICSQIGGENRNSVQIAKPPTIAPSRMMISTAPASPVSLCRRSNPQTGQVSDTASSPLKSLPRPHRGQRQLKIACGSEIGRSLTYSTAIWPAPYQ